MALWRQVEGGLTKGGAQWEEVKSLGHTLEGDCGISSFLSLFTS